MVSECKKINVKFIDDLEQLSAHRTIENVIVN